MRFRADVILLLAALVWGTAFVPQRVAAGYVGPFLFNGLRFLLGAMVLLPFVRREKKGQSPFAGTARRVLRTNGDCPLFSRHLFRWATIAGTLLVGASVCQQAGLKWTTAGNAGFLTALYVVLVPVVMFVGWGQRIGWQSWTGVLVAALGVYLLGVDDQFQIQRGDALELAGALLWALHLVVVGRAVKQVETLAFSVGQFLVAGALNVAIGLLVEPETLPGLAYCWWAVVYVGVFSVAIGYTLQAVGQKHAPATDAAIVLSMEAVFAALFGYLLRGEVLTLRQMAGCGLILAAMLVVQFKGPMSPEGESAPSPEAGKPQERKMRRISLFLLLLLGMAVPAMA